MTALHDSQLGWLEVDDDGDLIDCWPRIETTQPREDYL